MQIIVKQITPLSDIDESCSFTAGKDIKIKDYGKMFKSGHSVIRALMFNIDMLDIKSFVSTHYVRHNVGITHWVKSNRIDRGGVENADRNTLVNHRMLINAQALINMSHARLCSKASKETREAMEAIQAEIKKVCPELAKYLVPSCEYLKECPEFTPCGRGQK